ncbi:MAG: CAP domain-containing protein [Pseudomonadota bacterium]
MTQANELERHMLELINDERTARGLSEVQLETNLNASAEDHSDWMLETNTFSHTGAGGSSATARMVEAGFDLDGAWRTAENIAIQSERGAPGLLDDVEDLHVSLMNSPGHRANILNPDLDYIGIGIEEGSFTYDGGFTGNSVIVTQNFAATQGDVDLDPGTVPTASVSAENDPTEPAATAPTAPPAQEPAPDMVDDPAPATADAFDFDTFLAEIGTIFAAFLAERGDDGQRETETWSDEDGPVTSPLAAFFTPFETDAFA